MFSHSRLTLARLRRGMTKIDLAKNAQVTTRTLSAYETGEREPTDSSLQAIADALNFPTSFFHLNDLEPIGRDAASFRALSKMTASQSGAARSAGALCIELNRWISERFNLPGSDIPSIDSSIRDPEAAAMMVRSRWGLGVAPAPNLVHLLESHGVRIFSLAEECREVNAFSFWDDGIPFICLNTITTAEHGRFDVAHELGHLIMHRGHAAVRGRNEETEANLFASAFLMPADEVKAHAPQRMSWSDLLEIKNYWNVSAAALNYRLGKTLGHTTEWNYRDMCIAISRYGRHQEPNPGPREQSQLLSKVFADLKEEKITHRDVAHDLCLPIDDLNALIFGLVLTSVVGGSEISSQAKPKLRLVT